MDNNEDEFDAGFNITNMNWPTAIAGIFVVLFGALCCLGVFAPASFKAIFN